MSHHTASIHPLPTDDHQSFSLFNALPYAVFVLEQDRHIRFINAQAEAWLSDSLTGVIGRPAEQFFAQDNDLLEMIEQCFAEGSPIKRYDHRLHFGDKGESLAHIHLSPLAFDQSRQVTSLLMMIDQPEGMATIANALDQQAASRSAGMMAAMLAHEVKNPLLSIRGAAQLLEQNAGDKDKPLTDIICREADRIKALMDNIEFFSNAPFACDNAVNIHEVLQYVRHVASGSFASHVTIHSQYDPSLPDVRGDRELLVQLFMNLVKNAAEALQGREDGVITLRSFYQINNRFRVAETKPFIALPIAITVEDNGGGIAEDMRPHLFDPFVTSKQDGKGLGLAIVAKIISDHGGAITLDNGKDGHTAFTILLPSA